MKNLAALQEVEEQIYYKRKTVRYDIRDLTVEQIVNKYQDSLDELWECEENNKVPKSYNLIYIPEYQRDFTWDENRQSKLIESIILGLPIPFIFVAENKSSAWEVVDGSQRIRTLHHFIKNNLSLRNLNSLDKLNGYTFSEMDSSRKGKILSTALRLIVLSEETTEDVKKDMFERINKGSDLLKPMESRKGIYKGLFNDFIYDYAKNDLLVRLTPLDKWLENRQEREEILLRFFALSENKKYREGLESIGVAKYLDKYLNKKNHEFSIYLDKDGKLIESKSKEYQKEISNYKNRINEVLSFIDKFFPYGVRISHNPHTKRSAFEAITLGTAEFLENNKDLRTINLDKAILEEGIKSEAFKKLIVGNQLHKRQKLNGRVTFIVDLLEKSKK